MMKQRRQKLDIASIQAFNSTVHAGARGGRGACHMYGSCGAAGAHVWLPCLALVVQVDIYDCFGAAGVHFSCCGAQHMCMYDCCGAADAHVEQLWCCRCACADVCRHAWLLCCRCACMGTVVLACMAAVLQVCIYGCHGAAGAHESLACAGMHGCCCR